MNNLSQQLTAIELAEEKLKAKKFRTLEKALRSESPEDMVKANQMFSKLQQSNEKKQEPKAFFIDPLEFNSNLGFKDKPFSLTYFTLKKMAKAPIINSIIKTRKNQIADFASPQENKYSTGFLIQKKSKGGIEQKMDNRDKKIAIAITDFLMNGGNVNAWNRDDFDTFIRKIVDDSLIYDQMTFECIRNRRGQLESFLATDASTFRISDSFFSTDYQNTFFKRQGSNIWERKEDFGKKIQGYYPSYVQVYQNEKVNEFYPWELCFGIRNPSSSIWANGYGCSELEELINIVTSMLWGDEYNRRFFSQGSAPKGLLRIKGVNNENAIQQFKQQWQSMISGVMQSWKTPVVEADVDWIDLQKNNKDMEYSKWTEYLIKIASAVYSIDPSEIGWDISRSSGGGGLFEGSQEQRLQHSKDKGLYPLLRFIQRKINKYIVEQINPDFEFAFVGLNGLTIEQELDMDIKKTNSFVTINETREKYELNKLEFGDIPSNGVYLQNKNVSNANAQQGNEEEGNDENNTEENPFERYNTEDDEEEKAEDNIFVKAFETFLEQEENKIL